MVTTWLVLLLVRGVAVIAQSPSLAECNPSVAWWTILESANGDDPCATAQALRVGCGVIEPLLYPSVDFNGSSGAADSACICSPATYDVYGACQACQSEVPPSSTGLPSLSDWQHNCGFNSNTVYRTMAQLPDWVNKVNFTGSTFDIAKVLLAANSTYPSPLPPSITATQTSSGITVPSTSPTRAPSASLEEKKTNIVAIVAGLLGGFACLALAGLLALCFIQRRKRSQVAPSAEFAKYMQQPALTRSATGQESEQLMGHASPVEGPYGEEAPGSGELEALPTFTPGRYVGPIFEKGGYTADPNIPPYAQGASTAPVSSSPV